MRTPCLVGVESRLPAEFDQVETGTEVVIARRGHLAAKIGGEGGRPTCAPGSLVDELLTFCAVPACG